MLLDQFKRSNKKLFVNLDSKGKTSADLDGSPHHVDFHGCDNFLLLHSGGYNSLRSPLYDFTLLFSISQLSAFFLTFPS